MRSDTSPSASASANTADDDDSLESELDALVRYLGPCARVYWEMDQCLDRNKHQWAQCQQFVKKLKQCYEYQEASGQVNMANRTQYQRRMQLEMYKLKQSRQQKQAAYLPVNSEGSAEKQ